MSQTEPLPSPRRIDPELPHALSISWRDGGQGRLAARRLRQVCRCASCVEEMTGRQLLDPETVPDDIELRAIELVGRYGLSLEFSDGHSTGIYTFVQLRGLSDPAADAGGSPPSNPR